MKFLNSLEDIEFWRKLFPRFHISSGQGYESIGNFRLKKEVINQSYQDLIHDGYFQCRVINPKELEFLADCVQVIHNRVGLALFALIYDEFWITLHRLSPLLKAMLGEKYWILPSFWVWFLDAKKDEGGWAPHRDYPQKAVNLDGSPNNLTFWIALTEATTLNGCIYVLPGSKDPNYPRGKIPYKASNFKDVEALPAKAGSIIGWNGALLHWGSPIKKTSTNPRISFSFGFQRRDAPSMMPYLINPHKLPSFKQRLGLIGQQILGYGKYYQPSNHMKKIAQGLMRNLPEFKLFI